MPKRETNEKVEILGVRHGDIVRVMAGRSKGKTGKVLSVNRAKRRVTVEHANIMKKHTRPNPSKNVRGGILDKEGPIHISNVMLASRYDDGATAPETSAAKTETAQK